MEQLHKRFTDEQVVFRLFEDREAAAPAVIKVVILVFHISRAWFRHGM